MKNRQLTTFTTAKQFVEKTQIPQTNVSIAMTKSMIQKGLYFTWQINQQFKIISLGSSDKKREFMSEFMMF